MVDGGKDVPHAQTVKKASLMRIAGIYIRSFEPFADQPLEFALKSTTGLAEVHFFVGQNGTGKTRLLSLLAAACGNPAELEFRTSSMASNVVISLDAFGDSEKFQYFKAGSGIRNETGPLSILLGKIASDKAANQGVANLFDNRSMVAMAFRSVPSLEDKAVTPMGEVKWPDKRDFLRFNHHMAESGILCQALANLKVRVGIASSDPKDRTVRMAQSLDKAIRSITDQEFILTVGYVNKDLKLKVSWAGKEMQLKQLPDGLRSICGWLASCVAKLDMLHPDIENPLEQPLILLLDEPDAHLHPAWQRKLIPAVQRLLPNAQIFVATHSPFVISSVNEGSIYIFNADDKGKVTIKPPQPCSKGDSYIDVVEDVLGIKEQFDPETEKLLSDFRAKRDVLKKEKLPGGIDELKQLAAAIASRSDTLQFMMGRELAQLDAQLSSRVN